MLGRTTMDDNFLDARIHGRSDVGNTIPSPRTFLPTVSATTHLAETRARESFVISARAFSQPMGTQVRQEQIFSKSFLRDGREL